MKPTEPKKHLGITAMACLFAVIAACSDAPNPDEARAKAIAEAAQAEKAENKAKCDALQAKVDAEGRPGWEGLSAELKEELKDLPPNCRIAGNERHF
ncbi:MAG: hypothetical protein AAGL90_04670 [Pseudomonadota bacterium]